MSPNVSRRDYPNQVLTVGDHIRKVRIHANLYHTDVANAVGCGVCSVNNWEMNHSEPELRFIPKIIEFLGYNPKPMPSDTLGRLAWYKWSRGLNYIELGNQMGIHPEQLTDWISGRHKPFRKSLDRIDTFLAFYCRNA